jgi:hypothetical protein
MAGDLILAVEMTIMIAPRRVSASENSPAVLAAAVGPVSTVQDQWIKMEKK